MKAGFFHISLRVPVFFPGRLTGERTYNMKIYRVGIDIGGTSVKGGLFGPEGQLIRKWSFPTDRSDNGSRILPDTASSIRQIFRQTGLDLKDLAGIGVGVPGAVTDHQTVNRCVNLGWGALPAGPLLSRLMDGIPVRIANDANAAALGESWAGSGRDFDSLVMVTIGTGIGAGLIQGGRIVEGAFGAAGEIGHLLVNEEEQLPCSCGGKGHLEQYASASGLAAQAEKLLASSDTPSLLRRAEHLDAEAVYKAAGLGDPLALKLTDQEARMLGLALSYVSCVFDPGIFLIGGGLSLAGDVLLEGIRRYYRKYAFHASRDTAFALAKLGPDAGIYGAARLIQI